MAGILAEVMAAVKAVTGAHGHLETGDTGGFDVVG